MKLKIASWNIKWVRAEKGATDQEVESVVKGNKHKLLIAKHLIDDYDIVALLEADSDKDAHIELDGYTKIFCSRNYSNKKYAWNGILLYIRDCYSPYVNEDVLGEFETNQAACFLPVNITVENISFNCIFLWALVKRLGELSYGYNRIKELLGDEGKTSFKKTRDFIDGSKNNVIMIGDYNILYPKSANDTQRINRWNSTIEMMSSFSLKRVENNKYTYDYGINDYCFVSNNLFESATLEVGENKYGGVKSDHRLLSLALK